MGRYSNLSTTDALKASGELVGVWALVLVIFYYITKKADEKYPLEYYKVFTGDHAEEERAEWQKKEKENKKNVDIFMLLLP